jgi:hypothetical protein
MTTTLEQPDQVDRRRSALTPITRLPARPVDRRDRVGSALSTLFAARDDLGGVSPVADVLAEDLLWSV